MNRSKIKNFAAFNISNNFIFKFKKLKKLLFGGFEEAGYAALTERYKFRRG